MSLPQRRVYNLVQCGLCESVFDVPTGYDLDRQMPVHYIVEPSAQRPWLTTYRRCEKPDQFTPFQMTTYLNGLYPENSKSHYGRYVVR